MPEFKSYGIDVNGDSEKATVAWDFKNTPEYIAGLTIQSSPAPVIQVITPSGGPTMNVGTPVVSGSQVQSLCNIEGATIGLVYYTVCRAYFAADGSIWRYCYGALELVGATSPNVG